MASSILMQRLWTASNLDAMCLPKTSRYKDNKAKWTQAQEINTNWMEHQSLTAFKSCNICSNLVTSAVRYLDCTVVQSGFSPSLDQQRNGRRDAIFPVDCKLYWPIERVCGAVCCPLPDFVAVAAAATTIFVCRASDVIVPNERLDKGDDWVKAAPRVCCPLVAGAVKWTGLFQDADRARARARTLDR